MWLMNDCDTLCCVLTSEGPGATQGMSLVERSWEERILASSTAPRATPALL